MKNLVQQFASLLPRKFLYCDIGARGGVESHPWGKLLDIISVIGFEPDPDEYASLLSSKRQGDQLFNTALYRETCQIQLNLTNSPGNSSIYEPNPEFLYQYPDTENRFQITKKISINAVALDDLYEKGQMSDLDFVKIDVQGAELDIIHGGRRLLADNVLGMMVEVEFHPLYKNQPLFSDLDPVIRNEIGLELQDIQKTQWKRKAGVGHGPVVGQTIFGDALYFRSPKEVLRMCRERDVELQSEKILMACLMGTSYGYLDYTLTLLNDPETEKILGRDVLGILRSAVLNYAKCFRYDGIGSEYFSFFFNLFYRACQPNTGKFATSDRRFGSKKRLGIFH